MTLPEPSCPTRCAPLLQLKRLSKRYGDSVIFQGAELMLHPGECVALLGESGVGKSTLLNCIAGLDEPSAGEVLIDGIRLAGMSEDQRAALRRTRLGFVFQAFHVLPHLNVTDNVSLPLRLQGLRNDADVERLLHAVGLQAQAQLMPAQLSGGQLQRLAIARALVHRPALVLADEPTGNLDPNTADAVLSLLLSRVREGAASCLLVTHSASAAARADRVLRLTAQCIESVLQPDGPGAPRGGALAALTTRQ